MSEYDTTLIQERFIEAYIENLGSRAKAAEQIGVQPLSVNLWFDDPAFNRKLTRAKRTWLEEIRATGLRRARAGRDGLIEFFLCALEPETYDPAIRKMIHERKLGLEGDENQVPKRAVFAEDDLPPQVADEPEPEIH